MSRPPNILLAISDDQAWPYAGACGCRFVQTPVFDRVAREGALFTHAFCPAPQCSPSRAALLTGRQIWQLEEAGTHCSFFPRKYQAYPDLLEAAGYTVGYTGKPWGPGNWQADGLSRNPAGDEYNARKLTPPSSHISDIDYAANFAEFLRAKPPDSPFCFWFGCHEPHRSYEKGSWRRAGKRLEDVEVPVFLPDTEEVRGDLLDYAVEIEWFDRQLGLMLERLEKSGELEHTLVVVTSDNGMPFPRAKANLYEHGCRVPLAVRWGGAIPAGQVCRGLTSFIDIAPTFLEAAGLPKAAGMAGASLLPLLRAGQGVHPEDRPYVLLGRERHIHARADNVGYPSRAIRTHDYLYVVNYRPERWPAGDPPLYGDVDSSPTKELMLSRRDDPAIASLFHSAFGLRPGEELYALSDDPHAVRNVAEQPEYAVVREQLRSTLTAALQEQLDPRAIGFGDLFDSYPHYVSRFREQLPGFKRMGEYNPAYMPDDDKSS